MFTSHIITDGTTRKLVFGKEKGESIRVLTESQIQALSDGDLTAYRNKLFDEIGYTRFTDGDVVKAYDYMRHTVRREYDRRKWAGFYNGCDEDPAPKRAKKKKEKRGRKV